MNKKLSAIFKRSLMNLYKNGEFSIDYLILKADDLYSKGRLNETDYNELMNFFVAEQEKELETETVEETEAPVEEEREEPIEEFRPSDEETFVSQVK